MRAAALGVMEVAYRQEGPAALWKLVGRLSDQQRSLVEERLKYTDKQAAAQAGRRAPTQTQQQLQLFWQVIRVLAPTTQWESLE